MSIFARSTREPSGNSPARMRSKQIQILFHRAIAIRAVFARLGQRAAILANFLGRQIVDVSLAILDQLDRPLVELIEIIRSVEEPVPVEAEPLHVGLDRVDVLGLFLLGIGVVEAQIRVSAEFVGQSEVEADRLGVADVQIAVGLGRKARLHPAVVFVGLQIVENDVADKVGRPRLWDGVFAGLFSLGIRRFHSSDLTARSNERDHDSAGWRQPTCALRDTTAGRRSISRCSSCRR